MTQHCGPLCDDLSFEPYRPRFSSPVFTKTRLRRHLQTIFASFLTPKVRLPRSALGRFQMHDAQGKPTDVLLGDYHPAPAAGRPLVLLLHGLPGDRTSPLIRNAAYTFLRHGYPVLRLGLRGAGVQAGKTAELYHAGRTEDIHEVIEQLAPEWCRSGILIAGYSFGANMALKLLGETGRLSQRVRGGAASCAPIDLEFMNANMARRSVLGPFYERYLLCLVKKEVRKIRSLDDAQKRTLGRVKSFTEFNEAFFAKFSGFADAADYYRQCSAVNYLPNIDIPVLVMHSSDDPVVPMKPYKDFFTKNTNLSLCPLLCEPGGHAAYLDRHWKTMSWQHMVMANFFDTHF